MIKNTLLLFYWSIGLIAISQESNEIITERGESVVLMGAVHVNTQPELFAGQEYVYEILASSNHDVRVSARNADITLDESSLRNTGPIRYKVTPLDTGKCYVTIGLRIDDETSVSLLNRFYSVINFPPPPIHVGKTQSGESLQGLTDSTILKCNYPTSSGVYDSYRIKSWSAKLGSQSYKGNGELITKELFDAINTCKEKSILYFNVELYENKTGHDFTEGVFIIN